MNRRAWRGGDRVTQHLQCHTRGLGLGGRHRGVIEGIQASEDDGATQFRLTVAAINKGRQEIC